MKKEIYDLRKKIKELEKEIADIQRKCSHVWDQRFDTDTSFHYECKDCGARRDE